MIYKQAFAAALAVFLFISTASAQKAEMTISLNEGFLDALLDSVFQNFEPPRFSLRGGEPTSGCDETITVLRHMDGVRTGARFRPGVISMSIAFSGRYSLPFVGCVDFSGTADAVADVFVDGGNQRLIARSRVTNVNLSGTKGVGSSVVARFVRGSIDKKINPIEIVKFDKLSFGFPIGDSGTLKMKAIGVRHEVANRVLHVHTMFEFQKGS